MPTVNIVVTCTKRKSRHVPPTLRLRTVRFEQLEKRVNDWVRRLTTFETQAVQASSLYAGDQWRIARELPDLTIGGTIRLWVCSAGYGLISADALIKPYSATFSRPHPDSVRNHGSMDAAEHARLWWNGLSEWEGPVPGDPRTLESLAKSHPRSPLIVIASNIYLMALEADILRAVSALRSSQQFFIISGGTEERGPLGDFLIPCDARFQTLLGGALMTLNIRLVRRILTESQRWPLHRERLRERYRRLLDRQPDVPTYDRQAMTDGDVLAMIRKWLSEEPTLKHSPMLRRLRDTGFACEQKRFRSLYRRAQEKRNVG